MMTNYLQTYLKILLRYPNDFTIPLYYVGLDPAEPDICISNDRICRMPVNCLNPHIMIKEKR